MAVMQYKRSENVKLTANFTSNEFDCKGTKKNCEKTEIDSVLYRKLQVLRNRIGVPISINSGYRCKAHNSAVGGSDGSYHMKGCAADIRCSLAPTELAKAAQQVGFSGIGMYSGSAGNFVHVDVRSKGYLWKNTAGKNITVGTHGGKSSKCPYNLPSSSVRRGSKGNGVRAVQWIIGWAGYPCTVDGKFGAKTDEALKNFQEEMCLETDGIVGVQTLAALREVSS